MKSLSTETLTEKLNPGFVTEEGNVRGRERSVQAQEGDLTSKA